jgi:ankyrin repeat protein
MASGDEQGIKEMLERLNFKEEMIAFDNGKYSILDAAFEIGGTSLVETLFKLGLDPNQKGTYIGGIGGTFLDYAIRRNNQELVNTLLKAGINIPITPQDANNGECRI